MQFTNGVDVKIVEDTTSTDPVSCALPAIPNAAVVANWDIGSACVSVPQLAGNPDRVARHVHECEAHTLLDSTAAYLVPSHVNQVR